MKRTLLPVFAIFLFSSSAFATTWNEPWHRKVVTLARSFVRGEVLSCDAREGLEIRVSKQLAGEKLAETLRVNGFSLLHLTSASAGHGPEFRFDKGAEYYFFLSPNRKKEGYTIPTPTTGFAYVSPRGVHATYTHSYYQALVDEDLYEATMTAIFQISHGEKADVKAMMEIVDEKLKKAPKGVPGRGAKPEDVTCFFEQHVALEVFAWFGTEDRVALLEPFLSFDDRFVQISAVRALGHLDTMDARERMMAFLEGENHGFARVLATWALHKYDAREFLARLKRFYPSAPTGETGFGGNIMDPRVGTRFPGSVKIAVAELIKEWDPEWSPPKEKEK